MAMVQFSEGDGSLPANFLHRKQLLNNIVDGMANTRPGALYAEIPQLPDSYEGGYRKVTYSALANAINGIAWFLKKKLGQSKDHQTLAYIGPNDLAYVMMILGAVKAGYKLLLASPRNTISDHISLFRATGCTVLLTSIKPHSGLVTEILKAHRLQVLDSPTLQELLTNNYSHFTFCKRFLEARNEPLMVVHTSGTTTVPKPIVYSHDFAASYIQYSQLAPPPDFESQVSLCQSNRLFVTLPFFHAGNLFATMFDAIANQTTVILPLSGASPSAQVVVDGLKYSKADALFLAPPFLEQIAKSTDMADFITANIETVAYGGGDVSQWAGDVLASKLKLFNFNGSTETGSYPLIRPADRYPSEDWKYIHPHPAAGLEFRPSVEGLFEAFIVRERDFENEQPVFKLFPHLSEYPTKDLWSPHPSKKDLWAYRGRADDIIVFKPGYMCDPTDMEQHVSQHPGVQAVLMAGTGRFQPVLLIERTNDQPNDPMSSTEERELTEQLWPIIEGANRAYKMGSRVSKSHILYTTPQKPMRRAGKGTVQRGPTLEHYKRELDILYDREGDEIPGNEMILPLFNTEH